MGNILKVYQYEHAILNNLVKPLIFCTHIKAIDEKAVSVNVSVAKELIKQSTTLMRTMKFEGAILSVISSLGENPVIKDIDVLFNPSYQIDVLKALTNVYRKKPFSIIWPGKYEEGKLLYAEEGYRDYKVYDIANYDITVII